MPTQTPLGIWCSYPHSSAEVKHPITFGWFQASLYFCPEWLLPCTFLHLWTLFIRQATQLIFSQVYKTGNSLWLYHSSSTDCVKKKQNPASGNLSFLSFILLCYDSNQFFYKNHFRSSCFVSNALSYSYGAYIVSPTLILPGCLVVQVSVSQGFVYE